MPDLHWATLPEDWPTLLRFYRRTYPERHPLRNRRFVEWQYRTRGRALVAVERDEVVAHLGLDLSGGYGWVINLWVDPEHRGEGLVQRMYEEAGRYGPPLAATNANVIALVMYANMGWHPQPNLVRYVKQWGPVEPREVVREKGREPLYTWDSGYWRQPGIVGDMASTACCGVSQPRVGGLRLIHLHTDEDPEAVEAEARERGYTWCDYVTSVNDPLCPTLDKLGWRTDDPVPWLSDPLVAGSRCRVTYLSEHPMPPDYVVSRAYSDHGRVARLPEEE